MDEAHLVGLGRYLILNGIVDRIVFLCQMTLPRAGYCRQAAQFPLPDVERYVRFSCRADGQYDREIPEETRVYLDCLKDRVTLAY